MTGKELHSQLPLSVICAVPSSERSYLLRLMFGSSFEARSLGRVWGWNFHALIEKADKDHSIVAVGVHRSQVESLSTKGSFVVPNWVSGEVDLPLDSGVLNSRSVRSDFKKIAEHKFTYDVTRDPKQFDTFYREMHVPYTQLAHGGSAQIEPFEDFRKKLGEWELVLVKNETGYIAGQLITYDRLGPRFYLVGVRDGSREFVKQRVLGAAYQFSFRHVAERGFRKVSLGFSRAFLNDGVLRYKQKLAQRITGCSGAGFALTVRSYNAATRSFLRNNPFIFRGQDGLCGAVFMEAEAPLNEAEIRELNNDYLHPGMTRLATYRFPSAEAPSQPETSRKLLANPDSREGDRVYTPEGL